MRPISLLGRLWTSFLRPYALPALVVFAAKSALADAEFVPTGSMEPTIRVGDEVVVNKLAYDLKVPFTTCPLVRWADPARGDIVVFFKLGDGERLVKRVVGIPGDVLELRDDTLLVNGARAGYPAQFLPDRWALRWFGPVRVPPGHYFMMGDNRDNSADSRYFGFVPRDAIVGKAEAVAFSVDLSHWGEPRFGRFGRKLR